MEEKIQEVEQYFRDTLISGDFTVKTTDEFAWSVLIDDKYVFSIWIRNGEDHLHIDSKLYHSYISFQLTEEDKHKIWNVLEPLIIAHERDVNRELKRKQYEALKIELNIE